MVHMGYESIGDTHSTQPVAAGLEPSERAGRFRGLKQECGLHLPQSKAENASRNSSSLRSGDYDYRALALNQHCKNKFYIVSI